MKILITGATGYIGQSLALKLASHEHQVHVLVRNQLSPAVPQHSNVRVFGGDIGDRSSIARAIKGCDRVFHVAGISRLWAKDRSLFYDVNVTGTRNLLQEAMEKGVKKFVYTSSCAVFGPSFKEPISEKDPRMTSFSNDYDLSKFIAECLVKEYSHRGLFAVIVNPSRVYGPGLQTASNPITRLIARSLEGKMVLLPGCKDVLANYAFIGDVVDGHIAAMYKGISGERYILGGENLSYRDVFSIIKEEINSLKMVNLAPSVMKGIGWIELIKHKVTGIEPAFTPAIIDRLTKNAALNCGKALQQLGYQITPFREGVRKTISTLKPTRYV
jgi:nucleoside-diphosphate-sugar epimerase